jgi:cytoskeleton protein RodZ
MNVKEKKPVADVAAEGVRAEIGQMLKQARERLNLSAADVAQHLRLSTRIIQSIEKETHPIAGLDAFRRGYIRSYAKFVKIPIKEINQIFEKAGIEIRRIKPLPAEGSAVDTHAKIKTKVKAPIKWMRVVSYAMGAVLIFLVGLWLYVHHEINNTMDNAVEKPVVVKSDAPAVENSPAVPTDAEDKINQHETKAVSAASGGGAKGVSIPEISPVIKPTSNSTSQVVTREWVDPR